MSKEIKVGDVFWDRYGKMTVLAIVDGWAMCGRPFAVPFTAMLKDIPFDYVSGPELLEPAANDPKSGIETASKV